MSEPLHPDGYLVKLVRDKIPELLAQTSEKHGEIYYRQMSQIEHVKQLRKKLFEEVAEYLVDPSIDELADILVVVNALARWDIGTNEWTELYDVAAKKNELRGAFEKRMGMYVVHPADKMSWASDEGHMPSDRDPEA